VNWS